MSLTISPSWGRVCCLHTRHLLKRYFSAAAVGGSVEDQLIAEDGAVDVFAASMASLTVIVEDGWTRMTCDAN